MSRRIWSFTQKLIVSNLLIISWMTRVLANEPELTNARVETLEEQKQVYRILENKQRELVKKEGEPLRPKEKLETKQNSRAKLLFNVDKREKPGLWVNENCLFDFKPGVRRLQLPGKLRRIGKEIILVLGGTSCGALALNPPGSVVTEIETSVSTTILPPPLPETALSPNSNLLVSAQNNGVKIATNSLVITKSSKLSQNSDRTVEPPSNMPNLFVPAQKANAVMVEHNSETNTTTVYALTDGGITVKDKTKERRSVILQGGQKVVVTSDGIRKKPEEFDLRSFYRKYTLAGGLGPGQENLIAKEPSVEVQQTIRAVRVETLAALENQKSRREASKKTRGFTSSFANDALGGPEGDLRRSRRYSIVDLNPPRQPSTRIVNPQVTTGTFVRIDDNTATFTPDNGGPVVPITVDFERGTLTEITIDGRRYLSGKGGLSGNDAKGRAFDVNGQVINVDVFGVNGNPPNIGDPYPGSLTTGGLSDSGTPGFRNQIPRDQ